MRGERRTAKICNGSNKLRLDRHLMIVSVCEDVASLMRRLLDG
jgi:hypothetical protein